MKRLSCAALLFTTATLAVGQRAAVDYPPQMPGSRVEVYKTIDDVELRLYVYEPATHNSDDRRPAIVFFFGGGFRTGTPRQFARQAEYLATRGMVAIAVDYRVSSRHGTTADRCVADGKSAIRWLRLNSERLGVDPDRIAAAGGSAGGHIAAATAILPGLDEAGEDLAVSAVPNALVLFNPAVVVAPVGDTAGDEETWTELRQRFGRDLVEVSPYHHVAKGHPPALILHGRADERVPFRSVEMFCSRMREVGNRCELVGYDEQPHGFFNYGRDGNWAFVATLRRADRFLVSLGWLTGDPVLGTATD